MKIVIGAPANGAELKEEIRKFLEEDERVTSVADLSSPDVTYPDVSISAADMIVGGEADRAILICGTGIGTAIAANKVRGARAATAHDLITARGAVENYDAQILCMGQNIIAPAYARALVDVWLDATHDPAGFYGPKVAEISAFEERR
ncbi:RpiB/LacA/LacB family sugar-phosphate isomerase [Flaviflexus massiliensis]|uniref:RpiB/LacA/LacB family sugar-phosphate isomerase n=1 Tax=Flaviflexus massiliensis TaxID=1522309 RepID=UPI0006D57397|nr:RpiB/LacA/LacB family sugar-phosphate isomerase [Flaviflexus massiliensis]